MSCYLKVSVSLVHAIPDSAASLLQCNGQLVVDESIQYLGRNEGYTESNISLRVTCDIALQHKTYIQESYEISRYESHTNSESRINCKYHWSNNWLGSHSVWKS